MEKMLRAEWEEEPQGFQAPSQHPDMFNNPESPQVV